MIPPEIDLLYHDSNTNFVTPNGIVPDFNDFLKDFPNIKHLTLLGMQPSILSLNSLLNVKCVIPSGILFVLA